MAPTSARGVYLDRVDVGHLSNSDAPELSPNFTDALLEGLEMRLELPAQSRVARIRRGLARATPVQRDPISLKLHEPVTTATNEPGSRQSIRGLQSYLERRLRPRHIEDLAHWRCWRLLLPSRQLVLHGAGKRSQHLEIYEVARELVSERNLPDRRPVEPNEVMRSGTTLARGQD